MKKVFKRLAVGNTALLASLLFSKRVYAEDTSIDATVELTRDTLDKLDPLAASDPNLATTLSQPIGIINRLMLFAFPIAGLILFVMIVWGGFQMLSTATTKKSIEEGRKRVTAAIIGFVLLFSSYWIVRVLEIIFGVSIL